MMTKKQAAEYIEEVSEKICIKHLGHKPPVWYYGGTEHNDDTLRAKVEQEGIFVSDGNYCEYYNGPLTKTAIKAYVRDWLKTLWENRESE